MGLINHIRPFVVYFLFLASILCFFHILRHLTPTISGDYILNSTENETQKAEEIITKSTVFPLKIKENKTVEIRILASDRGNGYLTRVVAALLKTFEGHETPWISICNTESRMFKELERFQKKILIWNISGMEGSTPVNRSDLNTMLKKEASDYWLCLQKKSVFRYVLLLQDDAVVVPVFSKLLPSIISQLDNRREIDYVKLFHSDYLRKIPVFPIKFAIAALLGFALHSITKELSVKALVSFVIILFLLLHIQFKSQFFADVRFSLTNSVYLTLPESCCIPAVIFRTKIKDNMAKELMTEVVYAGHAVDHILDESRFLGRQTDSNLVVHIGTVSSIRPPKPTM